MAGRCLEWLAEHAGLREGHCLALDAERNRLVHVAGFGVQPVTVNGFGIDLEAHDHHPLVQALTVPRPVVLAPETAGRLFSRRAPFLALPLHGADPQEQAPGRPAPRPPGHDERDRPRVGLRVSRLPARPRAAPDLERRARAPPSPGSGSPAEHPRPGDRPGHPHRFRGPHGHRERARRASVRDARRRERRPPPGRRHQQHALLLGPRPERGGAETSAPRELALVDPTEGSDLLFELISTTAGDARDGHGHRVRPAERLRPPQRDRGDPGQLPAAPLGGGRGPSRA